MMASASNERLPLLVYATALALLERDPAAAVEGLFERNQWGRSWRNEVCCIHRCQSKAHEVLGVYGGQAQVQFGGEQGIVLPVKCGDVVAIPAGVAHRDLGSSQDRRSVGRILTDSAGT